MMNKCTVILVVVLFSCNSIDRNSTEPQPIGQQLTGEWNNLSLRVDIQSKNNSDSNELFAVERVEWESKLKIKPIRTFFRPDSTWNSAHYNLGDTLVYDPSGKWRLDSNKLIMMQEKPSADTTIYTVAIRKDTATFEAVLDWDMDGQKDDLYFGKQIKIKD